MDDEEMSCTSPFAETFSAQQEANQAAQHIKILHETSQNAVELLKAASLAIGALTGQGGIDEAEQQTVVEENESSADTRKGIHEDSTARQAQVNARESERGEFLRHMDTDTATAMATTAPLGGHGGRSTVWSRVMNETVARRKCEFKTHVRAYFKLIKKIGETLNAEANALEAAGILSSMDVIPTLPLTSLSNSTASYMDPGINLSTLDTSKVNIMGNGTMGGLNSSNQSVATLDEEVAKMIPSFDVSVLNSRSDDVWRNIQRRLMKQAESILADPIFEYSERNLEDPVKEQ